MNYRKFSLVIVLSLVYFLPSFNQTDISRQWKKDLGNLATGPFNETGVEWGYSSSPVIYNGRIIVQCDLLQNSFLATMDIATGNH